MVHRSYLSMCSVSVMQAGVTCTSFLLTTQLESGDWKEESTATDDDTVKKLVTAVTSTFPKSGLTQFWKTCTTGSDQTRHKHKQVHEEMLQLTLKADHLGWQ